MARLDYKYGQVQWVDVHPGDILPDISGMNYFTVTEDMINPDGVLKHSSYFSTSLTSVDTPKKKQNILGYPYSCHKVVYTYDDGSTATEYELNFDNLKSVIGVGDTRAEAISEAKINLKTYLEYCKDNGFTPQ